MAGIVDQRVVVTVEDQHLSTIQTVASALRLAGMNITNVMPTVGIITGEVPHAKLIALAKVAGVAAVELDQEMNTV